MYKVKLENFAGPLDLLLYFIRRDEIDVYDIPIARITEEYMETLEIMETLNLNVAGEFILMAATLMRIKAKMLLPKPQLSDEDEVEDPRAELVQQLLEYQRFKEMAYDLDKLAMERRKYHPRGFEMNSPELEEDAASYLKDVTLFETASILTVSDVLGAEEETLLEIKGMTADKLEQAYNAIAAFIESDNADKVEEEVVDVKELIDNLDEKHSSSNDSSTVAEEDTEEDTEEELSLIHI